MWGNRFGSAARLLRPYGGDIFRWWDAFRPREQVTDDDVELAMMLCIAACFSARDDGTPELPFDPRTGVLLPQVWQRWLDWDPVRMVPRYAEPMRSMRAIWIDAGTKDEWFLDIGAEAFRRALADAGVPDAVIRFELIDGKHGDIQYRWPMSLAWLCEQIAP